MQRLNWRYANKGRAFIHGKTPRPSQKRIRLWRMAAGSSVYCACDAHSKPVANDSCHRNWIPCSRLLPYAGDDDETPDEGLDEGLFDSMNMLIHFPEASSQLVLTTWQNDAHTSIGGIHIYSSFWAFYHQQFRHLWQWLMISAWSFLIAQHFEGSPDEASPPGGWGVLSTTSCLDLPMDQIYTFHSRISNIEHTYSMKQTHSPASYFKFGHLC